MQTERDAKWVGVLRDLNPSAGSTIICQRRIFAPPESPANDIDCRQQLNLNIDIALISSKTSSNPKTKHSIQKETLAGRARKETGPEIERSLWQ